VGDSDANLPLSGTLAVTAAQLGQPVTITSPGPKEGLAGTTVSTTVSAADSGSGQTPTFTATGLPAGTAISSAGAITGTPTTAGTSTVTVTAQDGTGAQASTTFTWTVEPASDGIATTPLVGYEGLCLDVTSDNNTNGTAVDVYTCNGTGAQVWQPQSSGSLVNPQSGACLDDTGNSTIPGTQVEIWTCTGGPTRSGGCPDGVRQSRRSNPLTPSSRTVPCSTQSRPASPPAG